MAYIWNTHVYEVSTCKKDMAKVEILMFMR